MKIVVAVLGRRWQSACRIRYADSVCKPPKGAVSKDMVLSVWAKGVVRHQVSVMKLNANEPFT
jgi:hypothetical protein